MRNILAVLLLMAVVFVVGTSTVSAVTEGSEPINSISETDNSGFAGQPTPTPSNDGWTCTVNGQPADCATVKKTASTIFFVTMVILFVVVLPIAIFSFVVWLIMLIHAISNPIKDKALWIVLMIIVGSLVSFVYYFVVKRPFDKQKKQTNASTVPNNTAAAAPITVDNNQPMAEAPKTETKEASVNDSDTVDSKVDDTPKK